MRVWTAAIALLMCRNLLGDRNLLEPICFIGPMFMCWAGGLGWRWSKTLAAFRKRFIYGFFLSPKLPTQSSCSSTGSRRARLSLSLLKAASSRDIFSCVKPRLTAPRQIMPCKLRQTALLKYSGNLYSGSYTDDSGLRGEIEQISSADKAQEFPKVAFLNFCQ